MRSERCLIFGLGYGKRRTIFLPKAGELGQAGLQGGRLHLENHLTGWARALGQAAGACVSTLPLSELGTPGKLRFLESSIPCQRGVNVARSMEDHVSPERDGARRISVSQRSRC